MAMPQIDYESFFGGDFHSVLIRVFIGLGIILFGIFLGKVVGFALKKIFKKIELNKSIRPSFVSLIVAVINWSIYIIFVDLALVQLRISGLTEIITKILVVIPALVAALILISIGFSVAIYLRDVIEDSEVTGWKILSQYFFYFILYVAGVYALKIALISLEPLISNIILVLITAIVGVAIAYNFVKKQKTN